MKKFKIVDKKVKDTKSRKRVGLVEFTINDTHKAYAIGSVLGYNEPWNEAGLRKHSNMALEAANFIKDLESKGYKESDKAYLHDSAKTYVISTKDGTAVVKAKSKDSAIKFVKDANSAQGYEIVYKETNAAGKTFAVLKRNNDFIVVRGYHELDGTYEIAYFGFPDLEKAKEYLKNLV